VALRTFTPRAKDTFSKQRNADHVNRTEKLWHRNLSDQSYAVADGAAHLGAPAGTLGYHAVESARSVATGHGLGTDSHLHEFLFRGQHYGPTHPERGVAEAIDERKVRLNQLLARVGAKIVYTYDFGDGWEHGIVLEKGLPIDPNMAYPLCTGGRSACPPEDCGGIGGFYNLLEALQNPRHPQHEELLEWLGEDYDSEKFSIEAINQILHGRKKRAARSSG
jgi:Plasmid pRiA4b ORF-3-like protein